MKKAILVPAGWPVRAVLSRVEKTDAIASSECKVAAADWANTNINNAKMYLHDMAC
jgi:hypothetical protein